MDIPEQAEELVQQLLSLGYHSYQIHQIIADIPGFSLKRTLTPELEGKLIQVLEDYVQFARKCRSTRR